MHSREQLKRKQARRRLLYIRNGLNIVFMLLALVAMVGVCVFKAGEWGLYLSYGVGIVAVLIKMVEAVLRMPGIFDKYK